MISRTIPWNRATRRMAIFPTIWKLGHQVAVLETLNSKRTRPYLRCTDHETFDPRNKRKPIISRVRKVLLPSQQLVPGKFCWAVTQVSGSSGTGYVDPELCHTVRIALTKCMSWDLTPMKLVIGPWLLPQETQMLPHCICQQKMERTAKWPPH